MKVKQAKAKMNNLKQLYDNAVRIQAYCSSRVENDTTISTLENRAEINMPLGTFAAGVAQFTEEEIQRISNMIDNTDVSI